MIENRKLSAHPYARLLYALSVMMTLTLLGLSHACAPTPKELQTSPKIVTPQGHTFIPHASPALIAVRKKRTKRRAYPGVHPTLPPDHERDATCKDCHNGDDGAPRIPHRAMTGCLQCHVFSKAPAGIAPRASVANSFRNAGPAGRGARAFRGAPPTIPHPTQMRSRCLSCHGTQAPKALRTSHTQRVGCLQCHVPSRTNVPSAHP